MGHAAIFLAAGSGSRMRGVVDDKLLAKIAGKPVFSYSLEAFSKVNDLDRIVVVYRDEDQRCELLACLEALSPMPYAVEWIQGGDERQHSVFNGLEILTIATEIVLIHDCARPLVRTEIIEDLIMAAIRDRAAVLAHRVTDTIKQTPWRSRGRRRLVLKDMQRNRLWAMETPQAFKYETIFEAYREVRLNQEVITDDTAAVSNRGIRVSIVENPYPNPKITVPQDLGYAEYLIEHPVDITDLKKLEE